MPFIENQRYDCQDGMVLQREQGATPSGNPIGGRWVLRAADGSWIDCDQYRYDIAQRHGLTLHPHTITGTGKC